MDLYVANNLLNQKKERQDGIDVQEWPAWPILVLSILLSLLAGGVSWKANTEINPNVGTLAKVFYAVVAFLFSGIYYVFYALYYGLYLGKKGICKL